VGFWDYFKAILAICAVLAAALYVTKLAAKTGGRTFRKSANIKLIASLPLARDKAVVVVAFGEYAYLLGVGGHHVERLDKLPLSEIELKKDEAPPEGFGASFKEELISRLKNLGSNTPDSKL
jgi:flagellar biogenesis protein FliO